MKLGKVDYKDAGFLSRMVLYVLMGVAVLVFCAFYLVCYELPYDEDPRFNAPALTDMLLGFIALLVLLSLSVGAWSVVTGFMERKRDSAVVNGIPVAKIVNGIAAVTALMMLLAFALGSSSAVVVNGKVFSGAIWLRTADMFVVTSFVMIACAVGAVVFGYVYRYMKGYNDDGKS